jgi:hypothetical protein
MVRFSSSLPSGVAENTGIVGVRNEQIAVAAEGEPRGLAVGEFWRLPAAEIFAVRGEDGDSRRDVDNVEVVVFIDRDRPRLSSLPGVVPGFPQTASSRPDSPLVTHSR